jgi:hypothetical protein
MALGQIGPLTTVLEAFATAVAAGVVLGSVGVGSLGLVLGWSRHSIGDRAVTDGYVGGVVGAAVAVIDVVLRYCA